MECCEELLVAREVAEDMQLDLTVVGFTGLENPLLTLTATCCPSTRTAREVKEEEKEEAVVGCLRGDGLLQEPTLRWLTQRRLNALELSGVIT
jgi:hypothetical protein